MAFYDNPFFFQDTFAQIFGQGSSADRNTFDAAANASAIGGGTVIYNANLALTGGLQVPIDITAPTYAQQTPLSFVQNIPTWVWFALFGALAFFFIRRKR